MCRSLNCTFWLHKNCNSLLVVHSSKSWSLFDWKNTSPSIWWVHASFFFVSCSLCTIIFLLIVYQYYYTAYRTVLIGWKGWPFSESVLLDWIVSELYSGLFLWSFIFCHCNSVIEVVVYWSIVRLCIHI